MWTGPPPAWNQTVSGIVHIQTTVIRVLSGSTNVQLRWNYTLLDGQSIGFTIFSINDGINQPKDLGHVIDGNPLMYHKNYQNRFTLDSTNEFATLTINTVTERENVTFQCRITADGQWAYNIRLEVTGKWHV